MISNRFIQVMVMVLSSDILKYEEELEQTINSNISVDNKIKKTKKILGKIINSENKLLKFNNVMANIDDDDDNNK